MVRPVAGDATFKRAPRRISAEITEIDLGGRHAVIALPTAFMNESGGPVSSLVKYFKPHLTGVVLVHDDIDLPFGKLRFHAGRGAGGHNGVASVMRSLGSREVWRMKLGVGRPPGRQEPADFVLERFPKRQLDDVRLMVSAAVDVLVASAPRAVTPPPRQRGTPPPDSVSRAVKFVGAIDQGTTSTRFVVVDRSGRIVGIDQREHAQIYSRPGWVEHDAAEIWRVTQAVVAGGLAAAGAKPE